MDNIEYIDDFFSKEPTPAQVREFEEKIQSDPGFAEDVSFYLSAIQAGRETAGIVKKEHFKEIYQNHPRPRLNPVRKLVNYMAAAAAVAGIIFGVYTMTGSASPKQLADQYIKDNLETLGVTMSARSDSLQDGLRLYNAGKPDQALAVFEKIILSDTSSFNAKKYAGLAALRMKEYDKAMSYFEQLELYNGLYSNPALILQAVTLMERNQPGDAAKAKILLQKVVADDLEGKEIAREWLKKM